MSHSHVVTGSNPEQDSPGSSATSLNRGKAGTCIPAQARPKPTATSGIPMVRSRDQTKVSSKISMPPPSLPTRSQSLQRPLAVQSKQEASYPSGVPRVPVSSQGPLVRSIRPAGLQTTAGATNGGLARSASSRIPGSPLSIAKQASSPRSMHSRTQSVTSSISAHNSKPGPAYSTATGTTHIRSKSSSDPVKSVQRREHPAPQSPLSTAGGRYPPVPIPVGVPKVRPDFNTLQQHYSPAKPTPKSSLRSAKPIHNSESAPSLAGGSFEESKIQYELLYLSLLHREAEPTLRLYESTAHKALRKMFEILQHERKLCRQTEDSHRERINVQALVEWSECLGGNALGSGQSFAEAVRTLSMCFHELVGLSGPDGRYSALIRDFTAWIEKAEPIFACSKEEFDNLDRQLIDALPSEWHEAHTTISHKLRLLERDINGLPQTTGDSESTLARMLEVLRSSSLAMKQELGSLLDLEQQVLARETQRIEKAVAKIKSGDMKTPPVRVPAWHKQIA